jgi:hypothetical protein
VLLNKANATPSVSYGLFTTHDPEAVLWLGFTSKDSAVKAKYELFLKTWPEARQRIPYAQMLEMRITPELPAYKEIVHQIFLQLIDGKLNTPEEIKAFLEPHSPPAPPPQITIKRTRAKRNVEKIKEKSFDDDEESEDGSDDEEDLDDIGGGDDEDVDIGLPKGAELEEELGDDEDESDEEDESGEDDEDEPVRKGRGKVAPPAKPVKGAKKAEESAAKAPAKAAPPAKPVAKGKAPEPAKHEKAKPVAAPVPAKKHAHVAEKHPAKPAPHAKAAAKPASKPVKTAQVKAHTTKPAHKSLPSKKPAAKPTKAHTPAKVAKKPAAKNGKKK